MASAWLRLAAERTVHGSDQKIHVVGAAEGGALRSNRRRSPVAASGCIIITKPYYVTLRYGLIRETRPAAAHAFVSRSGSS